MAVEPCTLRDLLKDPLYKKWFMQVPRLNPRYVANTPNWRVFCLTHDGKWKRAEFWQYSEAYRFVAKNIKKYADLVISSKRETFKPPVIRYKGKKVYWPCPPGHRWCGYCRRPTVFAMFSRHHAIPIWAPYDKRCSICGARESFLPAWRSPLSWEELHA
jgi:hypothetical protein